MISFGSGADALIFDGWHIGLFATTLVCLGLFLWARAHGRASLENQLILQEAEVTTLRARLEGELESARMRADEDAKRFADQQDAWTSLKSKLEMEILQSREQAELHRSEERVRFDAQLREDRERLELKHKEERERLEKHWSEARQREGAQSSEDKRHLEAQWTEDKKRLQDSVVKLTQRAESAENKLSAFEAQAEERAKAIEEERNSLKAMAEDIEKRFQHLADGALRKSQTQFIEMADQHLKKHKEGAEGELKKLIQPINESFQQFREKVDNVQKVTAEERSSMQAQMRALMENMSATQKTTTDLANALRAPKGGGRWGEETLRNVLEMAGLSPFSDFSEQSHTAGENGAIRPDVTVNMPGGRQLVIDSKVSVDDYLLASETDDIAARERHLATHARNVRKHVDTLGKKSYWDKLPDTVDFVAMFIPGENFYAAALEHDRSLFDFAAKNRVIIVTPSTLIALAKAVAYGWRQEEAADNAREITDLARDLYKRISAFGDKVAKLGRNISQSALSYNELVGSLEGNVLPQARKFEGMGADADGKTIPQLSEIDTQTRQPRRGRDLLFSDIETIETETAKTTTQKASRKRASS